MSYITENFHKWTPEIAQYAENDRIAIQYITEEDGYPEYACTATINLPKEHLEPGEVIIKNYSENEGLYDMMLQAGHIGPAKRYVRSGWITVPVCDLLIKQ